MTWSQTVAPNLAVTGNAVLSPRCPSGASVGTRAEVSSRRLGRLGLSHGKCPCQAGRLGFLCRELDSRLGNFPIYFSELAASPSLPPGL